VEAVVELLEVVELEVYKYQKDLFVETELIQLQ
jgi:hypothetical protein